MADALDLSSDDEDEPMLSTNWPVVSPRSERGASGGEQVHQRPPATSSATHSAANVAIAALREHYPTTVQAVVPSPQTSRVPSGTNAWEASSPWRSPSGTVSEQQAPISWKSSRREERRAPLRAPGAVAAPQSRARHPFPSPPALPPSPASPGANANANATQGNSSMSPVRARKRIPGPAGRLAPVNGSRQQEEQSVPSQSAVAAARATDSSRSKRSRPSYDGLDELVFLQGSWQSLCNSLGMDLSGKALEPTVPASRSGSGSESLARYPRCAISLRAVQHHPSRSLRHVPLVTGVLTSVVLHDVDALVTLTDPTASMRATIHRRVIEEHGPDVAVGAALVLRKVSVFSPAPGAKYLNITADSVLRLFPANTPPPRERPPRVVSTAATAPTTQHSHDVG